MTSEEHQNPASVSKLFPGAFFEDEPDPAKAPAAPTPSAAAPAAEAEAENVLSDGEEQKQKEEGEAAKATPTLADVPARKLEEAPREKTKTETAFDDLGLEDLFAEAEAEADAASTTFTSGPLSTLTSGAEPEPGTDGESLSSDDAPLSALQTKDEGLSTAAALFNEPLAGPFVLLLCWVFLSA